MSSSLRDSPDPSPAETRPCPYCAEPILSAAIRCKHCGADVRVDPDEKTSLGRTRFAAAFAALLVLALLAALNPSMSDYRRLAVPFVEPNIPEPRNALIDDLIVSDLLDLLVFKTHRQNLLFFSLFHVDTAKSAPWGVLDVSDSTLLGVGGALFRISGSEPKPSEPRGASQAPAGPSAPQKSVSPKSFMAAEGAAFCAREGRIPDVGGYGSKSPWAEESVGPHGVFGVYPDEANNVDFVCLNGLHVPLAGAELRWNTPFEPRGAALLRAFELPAREIFGIPFGGRDSVYLLQATQKGYVDQFYPNVCFFAVVSGKSEFWVSERIQCPDGVVGNFSLERSSLSDRSGFETEGTALRWSSRSPLNYAENDIGHFELRENSIRALHPYISPSQHRDRFAANPLATVEQLQIQARSGKDGVFDPKTESFSLNCPYCENEASKYCFPWQSAAPALLIGNNALDSREELGDFVAALSSACGEAKYRMELVLPEDEKQASTWPAASP